MSNISTRPEMPDSWENVTWEGNERLQLRRMRELSLREKVLAIQGLSEVAARMQQLARQRRPVLKEQP